MFLIVCHHIIVHGAFLKIPAFSTNVIISQIMTCGGKLGVNIFVIITGFFLIEKAPKISSIVKLYLECVFYITVITLVFVATGKQSWSFSLLATFIYPFGTGESGEYWFVAAYLDLMLVSPFLTIGMRSFSKKQYLALLIMLTVAWSGFRTFSWMLRPVFTYGEYAGYSLLGWFVLLFLWGGYVRKHVNLKVLSATRIGGLIACSALFIIIWILVKDLRSSGRQWQYIQDMNSLFELALALTTFMAFAKMSPLHNRVINSVASTMLGVYLIHDLAIVRKWLWPQVIKPFDYYNDWYFIFYCVGASLLVLFVCSILDFIRQRLCSPFQSLLSPLSRADSWLSQLVTPVKLNRRLTNKFSIYAWSN